MQALFEMFDRVHLFPAPEARAARMPERHHAGITGKLLSCDIANKVIGATDQAHRRQVTNAGNSEKKIITGFYFLVFLQISPKRR